MVYPGLSIPGDFSKSEWRDWQATFCGDEVKVNDIKLEANDVIVVIQNKTFVSGMTFIKKAASTIWRN